MAERYIRQIEFQNAVYKNDCPVALEKGAVLLDTKMNSYILQLKFGNIGTTAITSVQIYVEAVDAMGSLVCPGIFYNYDEYTGIGDNFGTKKLLPLPNNNAAVFRIYVETVKIANGDTYTFNRKDYTENSEKIDIARLRENAVVTEQNRWEQEKRIKNNSMWGAKWYHAVFAVVTVANLLNAVFVFMTVAVFLSRNMIILGGLGGLLLTCGMCIYTWVGFGTPKILKRAVLLALLSFSCLGVLTYVVDRFNPFYPLSYSYNYSYPQLLTFILVFVTVAVINILPFLCIFFNARRYDDLLKEENFHGYASISGENINTQIKKHVQHTNAVCPSCGQKIEQGAAFCGFCGGKIDG